MKNTIRQQIWTMVGVLYGLMVVGGLVFLLGNGLPNIFLSVIILVAVSVCWLIIGNRWVNQVAEPVEEATALAEALSMGKLGGLDRKGSVSTDLAKNLENVAKQIKSVIHDTADTVDQLSSGGVKSKSAQGYPGDFAQLKIALEKFTANFQGVIGTIDSNIGGVVFQSHQMRNAAEEIAQGATIQEDELAQLIVLIDKVASLTRGDAVNAQKANELSVISGQNLTLSNEKMNEMLGAIAEINKASVEISKVSKSIEDIAFQTNILALNASVEAARAGQAGKGFAVVADEVRNLATKSAQAAKNTTELVSASILSVNKGNKIAEETAEALLGVISSAKASIDIVNEISESTYEQALAFDKIATGASRVQSIVSASGSASATSVAASEMIEGQAGQLQTLVVRFKGR